MKVRVRYFASLREQLGDGETVQTDTGATVGVLRDMLIACDERHGDALSRDKLVRCALDRRMCAESDSLAEGAEVAFFPPVTGG